MNEERYTVVVGEGEEDMVDVNVKDIKINSFSVYVEEKEVVKNASLMLSHGNRYGLVGPNGIGKSTLLMLLTLRRIPVPDHIDLFLVREATPCGDRISAIQAVVSANQELVMCRKELWSLSADDATEEKILELFWRLRRLGSDDAEARAYRILVGLGFTDDMLPRPTMTLGVGWRKRISLAQALFVQPTLLLLDEPTNHLDLRAVLWLQEYLCRWNNTLLVVSHDRDFLNTICTDIIHLHDQNLHTYRCNFDAFDQQREEMNKKFEIHEKAERSGKQDKVKDWAKFAPAEEASNRKGKGKEMDEEGPAPEAPTKLRDYNSVVLDFPEPTELPGPLLQLIEVSYCYPGRPHIRLSNVDVCIDMGTRVAIVGPHEAGKSFLLKLIAGDLVPTAGEVRRSQKLRIGKNSLDQLTKEETPVEYLVRLHPDQEGCSKQEAVRVNLGKFGVPSHNHLTPIAELSRGQKARVVLASISMSKPHILVLDEPTDHLDMETIDALADALVGFKGGVVLMSHDSRLVSRVCEEEDKSQIWLVQDGAVSLFQGTFEEYKEELKGKIRAEIDDLTSI